MTKWYYIHFFYKTQVQVKILTNILPNKAQRKLSAFDQHREQTHKARLALNLAIDMNTITLPLADKYDHWQGDGE